VLSPEEQALLDIDWVGKNGTKRKMEVGSLDFIAAHSNDNDSVIDDHGPAKAEKVVPIRD
jgi:hypothetical protein